jgi:YVTN family beta-propeller protein
MVDLPFSAGALCHLDGERPALLVFDAFSGGWSAHDPNSLQVSSGGRNRSRRTSAAAIDPENGNVCLAGQSLNPLAHSIRNDVHWGLVVANQIRSCPASQFVSTSVTDTSGREPAPAESMLSGITIPLGGASDGKADPESIEFASNGTAVITLGGVDQVAVGQLAGASFQYYSTGRRPVATAVSGNNKRLFVCNFLDDSVTVIDMRDREIVATISLGPQPERTRVDEGERLFFDGRISHDGWMSCHSCHVNGHSNGFLNDNLGDQSFGAPKRVLSLLGRDGTAPFAWNGSASLLSEQIRSSIVNTMQSDTKPSEASVDALAAYVRSLAEPAGLTQSRSAPDDRALIDRIETGRSLFHELGCASCHVPDRQWTSPLTYDLGISDELGKKRFNPPSLKGVGQGATFFHDARYDELADVFRLGKHRLQRELSDDELRDLLAFLQSL